MYEEKTNTNLGFIHIHKDVIANIASIATLEIEGVARIDAEHNAFLKLFYGKQKNAMKVYISKDEEVILDIPIVIKYGYNIAEVSSRIQENVQDALDKMANLSIKNINIIVKGIERS